MSGGTVLTVGNFDGAHLGHAALIARARELAGPRGRVVALAFDPHPAATLRPDSVPARLSTFEQRSRWLAAMGADLVERLLPTPELLSLTPEAFIDELVERHAPVAFVEGEDFRFGARRAGDVGTLTELGRARGFGVEIVPAVETSLTDQTVVACSSTLTRWLIDRGRVRDAARVLGRPFTIEGSVARGDQRGRTIGVPTANLETGLAVPADGVYAGVGELPDGSEVPAAIHVGPRATFDCERRTIEAHLVGWDGSVDDYGWPLTLRFLSFLRGQARFDTVEALVEQMRLDIARSAELVASESPTAKPEHAPA